MSRIKKRGLDYFPISTDFIHDRIVRRIMKSEGDAAVTVLVETLCSIYTNEVIMHWQMLFSTKTWRTTYMKKMQPTCNVSLLSPQSMVFLTPRSSGNMAC